MTSNSLLLVTGTAALSDALDRLGIAGQCLGLRARSGYDLAGPAYTVRYLPVGSRTGTVGDYIEDVPPGSVVVLDNGGREDVTVWGELLTAAAIARGVAGTVVYGAHRDSASIRKLGYPIFSTAVYMRTGKGRVYAADTGGPVQVGGVHVEPGDFVVADSDGVVILPRSRSDEVRRIAEEIREAETEIARLVSGGVTLRAARETEGYHDLQSRADR